MTISQFWPAHRAAMVKFLTSASAADWPEIPQRGSQSILTQAQVHCHAQVSVNRRLVWPVMRAFSAILKLKTRCKNTKVKTSFQIVKGYFIAFFPTPLALGLCWEIIYRIGQRNDRVRGLIGAQIYGTTTQVCRKALKPPIAQCMVYLIWFICCVLYFH